MAVDCSEWHTCSSTRSNVHLRVTQAMKHTSYGIKNIAGQKHYRYLWYTVHATGALQTNIQSITL